MKINIIVKDMELSTTQREHIQKKLDRLDRFFGDEIVATAKVRTERELKIVEVTIPIPGNVLRAQEGTDELYSSLDAVMEKIQRQIRKHRTRLEKRLRENAFAQAELDDIVFDKEAPTRELVRTKSFKVPPMTTEEAIFQMEMLGHSFFLFLNQKTDEICVVYQRDDGNFGLLIPEK